MRTATIRRKLSEVRAETILDEERHVYGVPGWDTTIELPSVSAILDMVAPWDWEAPWEALGHGQAIHAALHYLDEGDLDEASVAPSIRPYVDRYKEWLEFAGYEVVASEVPLALASWATGASLTGCYGSAAPVGARTAPAISAISSWPTSSAAART